MNVISWKTKITIILKKAMMHLHDYVALKPMQDCRKFTKMTKQKSLFCMIRQSAYAQKLQKFRAIQKQNTRIIVIVMGYYFH